MACYPLVSAASLCSVKACLPTCLLACACSLWPCDGWSSPLSPHLSPHLLLCLCLHLPSSPNLSPHCLHICSPCLHLLARTLFASPWRHSCFPLILWLALADSDLGAACVSTCLPAFVWRLGRLPGVPLLFSTTLACFFLYSMAWRKATTTVGYPHARQCLALDLTA